MPIRRTEVVAWRSRGPMSEVRLPQAREDRRCVVTLVAGGGCALICRVSMFALNLLARALQRHRLV